MNSKEHKANITAYREEWVGICQHQVHSLFDELIHKTWGHEHWHPAVDVTETADAFLIEIDLPGVEADKVQILLENNRLSVEGCREPNRPNRGRTHLHLDERPFGKFHCCVDLPGQLEAPQMSRQYENGVMTLRIPKKSKK
jgi:HSP20 family protein